MNGYLDPDDKWTLVLANPQPSKEGDVREKIVHILIRGFATFSTEEKYRSPGADLSDITTKYADRLLTLFQSLLKEEREKGDIQAYKRGYEQGRFDEKMDVSLTHDTTQE